MESLGWAKDWVTTRVQPRLIGSVLECFMVYIGGVGNESIWVTSMFEVDSASIKCSVQCLACTLLTQCGA